MLRQLLHYLEWMIIFVLTTLILFWLMVMVTIKPVIASVTETEIAPGTLHCRSEEIVTDEGGHKWQLMLFTQVESPESASLNLRLSGLSSQLKIDSNKPLIMSNQAGKSWSAHNIFLHSAPLPNIGQYNLKNIFSQLATEELWLELPLVSGQSTRLQIPESVVKEWQEIAAKQPLTTEKPLTAPKLPSGYQLAC